VKGGHGGAFIPTMTKIETPISKVIKAKKDWGYGSSFREPA
jgi:hypothetical protein